MFLSFIGIILFVAAVAYIFWPFPKDSSPSKPDPDDKTGE